MNTEIERIVAEMKEALRGKPLMFSEVLDIFTQEAYRDVLTAWSQLREQELLKRTDDGLYYTSA